MNNKHHIIAELKIHKIFLKIATIIFSIIIIILSYFQLQKINNPKIYKTLHNFNSNLVSKEDVHILLKNISHSDLNKKEFIINFDHSYLKVNTSLDLSLQKTLMENIDKNNSRYVAIVVMSPNNGKIIAMTSFNKENSEMNPCITANFPAASIFKIITAAAAIEKCGYSPNSILEFNGAKHTLYKEQIVESSNRYTNKISLKNSFAQSVNPVFGKIGSIYLGANHLKEYGNIFGFNRIIPFEIPWDISNLVIDEDPYHWAEIASGFNRQTTISPMHGAVIASAIVNNGIPVEPTIIEKIVNTNGDTIYSSQTKYLDRAITINTATTLSKLMTATVTSGTGKKIFEGYKKHTVLSKLNIGGKTGSIYNKSHDTRFDWFVGFAKNKYGLEKIVVSVVVAHDKYIGKRAGQYAIIAIENYFQKYF